MRCLRWQIFLTVRNIFFQLKEQTIPRSEKIEDNRILPEISGWLWLFDFAPLGKQQHGATFSCGEKSPCPKIEEKNKQTFSLNHRKGLSLLDISSFSAQMVYRVWLVQTSFSFSKANGQAFLEIKQICLKPDRSVGTTYSFKSLAHTSGCITFNPGNLFGFWSV